MPQPEDQPLPASAAPDKKSASKPADPTPVTDEKAPVTDEKAGATRAEASADDQESSDRGGADIPASHLGRAWLALRMVFSPTHVAVGAPVLMVAVLGWQQRWVSDDGWINIRVVDQVLAGNGPVFNIGERVEVTTSTLWFWMLLLGANLLPGTEPQVTGVAMGWLLTLIGMIMASMGAARLFRGRRPITYLPVGTLAMAALPPFWDFTTSGLETGLSFAWLGIGFWLLTGRLKLGGGDLGTRPRWRRFLDRWPLLPAAWIGLGPLVRPDFGLYSLFFGLALLLTNLRHWHRWLISMAIGIIPLVIYQVWRMGYYAILVPNTALAKDASSTRWDQGLVYLIDYAGLYTLAAPLLVCLIGSYLHLLGAFRRRDLGMAAVILAPILAGLAHGAYIIRVGGDFMHARFLLPDTFAVMLPLAVIAVVRVRRETILAAVAFVAGWAVAIASGTRVPYEGIGPDKIANERGYYSKLSTTGRLVTRSDWLGNPMAREGLMAKWDLKAGWSYYEDSEAKRLPSRTGQGVYLAHFNMGILAVLAGNEVMVIDKLALADPVTSHSVIDPRLRDPQSRVGHESRPDAWRIARYAAPTMNEPVAVEHARNALNCGDLAVLQQAISEPLTTARFWQNVSLAPRLTRFSFPSDPTEARKSLCGWQPGW